MTFSLVGCSGSDAGNSASGNYVNLAKENDVISMDSRYATDGMSFEMLASTIEGLESVDADGNIIPALAESYDVSEDGLTYTFHLRDAVWSNDAPVTAQDFEYELPLAQAIYKLSVRADTIFLATAPEHSYISSSGVKEIFRFGGDIGEMVPKLVQDRLQDR